MLVGLILSMLRSFRNSWLVILEKLVNISGENWGSCRFVISLMTRAWRLFSRCCYKIGLSRYWNFISQGRPERQSNKWWLPRSNYLKLILKKASISQFSSPTSSQPCNNCVLTGSSWMTNLLKRYLMHVPISRAFFLFGTGLTIMPKLFWVSCWDRTSWGNLSIWLLPRIA